MKPNAYPNFYQTPKPTFNNFYNKQPSTQFKPFEKPNFPIKQEPLSSQSRTQTPRFTRPSTFNFKELHNVDETPNSEQTDYFHSDYFEQNYPQDFDYNEETEQFNENAEQDGNFPKPASQETPI